MNDNVTDSLVWLRLLKLNTKVNILSSALNGN